MSANREKSKIPFIERKKQYGTSCSTGITSFANFFHLPVETLAAVWEKRRAREKQFNSNLILLVSIKD